MKTNSYCEFCGKPIGEGGCSCSEAIGKRTKKAKLIKRAIPLASVCIILAIAVSFLIVFISNSTKFDPLDYTEISFSGYNGNGTVDVDFELYDLIEELIGEEPDDIENEAFSIWFKKAEIYEDGIDYEISPREGLSNGDKIEIRFTVTDAVGKKVKDSTDTYVVSGLTEVEKVDIFEDIEISFEGISGKAVAKLKLASESTIKDVTGISVDKGFGLSNGDTVTVTIKNVDYFAETYSIIPTILEKSYTVGGLTSYVKSVDQIPNSIIKTFAEEYVKQEAAELEDNDDVFTYGEVRYHGSYLFVKREGYWGTKENSLRIMVTYERYRHGELHDTVYTPLIFNDIVISGDGELNITYEDGATPEFTTDIDNYLSKNEDNYVIEEINIKDK